MKPRVGLGLTTLALLMGLSGAAMAQTVGPNGEQPTPSKDVTLTDAEVAQIKDKKATAALLWHTSSDFVNAVTAGAKDEFARLGIEVVAETDAGFDSAKQMSDVEPTFERFCISLGRLVRLPLIEQYITQLQIQGCGLF